MKVPHEETWTAAIDPELAKQLGDERSWMVTSNADGLIAAINDEAHARLIAAAPAMARALLARRATILANEDMEDDAKDIEDVLRAAGVLP